MQVLLQVLIHRYSVRGAGCDGTKAGESGVPTRYVYDGGESLSGSTLMVRGGTGTYLVVLESLGALGWKAEGRAVRMVRRRMGINEEKINERMDGWTRAGWVMRERNHSERKRKREKGRNQG